MITSDNISRRQRDLPPSDYPGRLIESLVDKVMHDEARYREVGGDGQALRCPRVAEPSRLCCRF